MPFGCRGIHRGPVDELYYRGIPRISTFDSSYGLPTAPISDISVTRGVASRRVALSPSFKLGVVAIVFFFCSMYFAMCCLAYSYGYDFSPLKAHDLAKVSGSRRSVRSKARAKGLCGVLRVLGRVPDGGRKNNKSHIFINFGDLR